MLKSCEKDCRYCANECKTPYIATYKKCTYNTILSCCKNNIITNSSVDFHHSFMVITILIIVISWNLGTVYFILNFGHVALVVWFIIVDICICIIIIIILFIYSKTRWYINTILVYFILYTAKNISYSHLSYLPFLFPILTVNIVFTVYLLVYYIYDCKNMYNDQILTIKNATIRSEV